MTQSESGSGILVLLETIMHLLLKGLTVPPCGAATALGYITWRSAPTLWVIILLIIPAVILFSYLIYRREKTTASLTVKLLLTALRSAVIIIVLLIIFQPVSVKEKPITKESILPILIDDSLSMGFKDKYTDEKKIEKLKILCADENLSLDLGAEGRPAKAGKTRLRRECRFGQTGK